MSNKKDKVTGKIVIKATVKTASNLLIGSGKGEVQDFEVIREEGELFIPASGFAGMINKHFTKWLNLEQPQQVQAEYLWGTDDGETKNPSQSHIIIDDLVCVKEAPVVVRDGVAIDPQIGTGKHNSKYDYELIEPGAEFSLSAEITLRQEFDVPTFLRFVSFITDEGIKGRYKQGAFTSHGFGKLIWLDVKVFHFEFSRDADQWFDYLKSPEIKKSPVSLPAHGFTLNTINSVTITGWFSIKNSLIIGGSDKNLLLGSLDKTHIKNSKGNPLLTSKSLRGPIRHRALKILKTLENSRAEETIDNLFGMVNDSLKIKKKGKIIPKEYEFKELSKIDATQIQPRIKIDRFTGGTIDTALLSSQPLWHKDEDIVLEFEIERYKPEELGVMLLVMKDLMNEDLPIGGEKAIGRGVLKGTKLEVKKDSDNYFELTVTTDGTLNVTEKGEFTLHNIEQWIKNISDNV